MDINSLSSQRRFHSDSPEFNGSEWPGSPLYWETSPIIYRCEFPLVCSPDSYTKMSTKVHVQQCRPEMYSDKKEHLKQTFCQTVTLILDVNHVDLYLKLGFRIQRPFGLVIHSLGVWDLKTERLSHDSIPAGSELLTEVVGNLTGALLIVPGTGRLQCDGVSQEINQTWGTHAIQGYWS